MTPRTTSTGAPRLGLIQFPGSNCDLDSFDVFQRHFQIKVQGVWHSETQLPQLDAVILPGGFSYGDYLRSGALAAHAKIMPAVQSFVAKGGPVLGICNGFQILTESHLLPGALLRNALRKFVCKDVYLATRPGGSQGSIYQRTLAAKTLKVPIAHGEGRYYIDPEGLKRLTDAGQIVFQYADAQGKVTDSANPNGALANIAGIVSANGRVLGMMPHPERACDQLLGSADGIGILEAFLASFL